MPEFGSRQTTQQHTAPMRMRRLITQFGPPMGEAFPKIPAA